MERNPFVDDVASRLADKVPSGLGVLRRDLENNFRAILHAALAQLDLVPRDEFDVQKKVLDKTRAKLTELESRMAELEAQLKSKLDD